ncbi:Ig-like domain-containing protein [bacterium]|nr:Ig-like domain-containing protein [bacterium]
MMQVKCILTLIVVFALSTVSADAAINDYTMRLRAQPQAIVADSFSATTITADVRDSDGDAVPDGTLVEFTTSLGVIENSAQTTSGIARVRLQSDTTIGTALISAVASNGRAIAKISVDFLAPGTEMFNESFISVSSSKYLGYDISSKKVDAAGGVTICHRGLSITAQEAQIDAKNNILRARACLGGDNIVIKRGDKQIAASILYYSFDKMSGVLITPAEDGAHRLLFRGRDMFTEPDTKPDEKIKFDFEPVAESNMFVRARSLIIRPGEEVKIKRANFYLEGDKVLSVPLHVLSLSDRSAGMGQMLTYGTDGLQMDLPIYYSLTPNGTGSVRLRHSESTEYNYSNAGWQLDLDQEYTSDGSTEGKFEVSRITSGDWGLSWSNRREFNNDSRLYTYFDFPSHKNLYGTVDYSRSLGNYNFSWNLRGNMLRNNDDRYYSTAYIQSRAKPMMGGALSYSFTTRLTYNSAISSDSGEKIGRGLGLQLYGKPIKFGQGTLNTSLTTLRSWGGSSPGTSIYASAGYSRNLRNIGSFGLNYSYSFADSTSGYNAQRLSSNLSLRPSQLWSSNINLTYGLDDSTISAFGDFGYTIRPTWRLSVQSLFQKFASSDSTDSNYSDFEISLAKALGRQQAQIIWSQSRRRFRVEFSALSF